MLHHHVAMSYTKGPFDRVASKMRVRLLRYIRSQTRLKNMGVSSCFHWCYQCRHIGISLHHLLSQVHHIPLEETPFFGWKSCPVVRGVWVSRSGNKKIFVKPDLPNFPTSLGPGVHLFTIIGEYLKSIGNWKIKECPVIEMLQDCFRQLRVSKGFHVNLKHETWRNKDPTMFLHLKTVREKRIYKNIHQHKYTVSITTVGPLRKKLEQEVQVNQTKCKVA